MDSALFALLSDPQYNLPTVLPTGRYAASPVTIISKSDAAWHQYPTLPVAVAPGLDCTLSMFVTQAEAAACSSDGGAHQMGTMWMVGATHSAGSAVDCTQSMFTTQAEAVGCSSDGGAHQMGTMWMVGATHDDSAVGRKTCATLGWNAIGSICAESSDGWACKTDATYAEAKTTCAAAGARVCTIEEIETGATAKTGCSMDTEYVWSSTWCGVGPKYYVGMGSGTGERKCKKDKKSKSIRCCSDVSVAAAAVTAATTTTTYVMYAQKSCAALGWPVVGSACGESDLKFKVKVGTDKCYNWLSQPDGEKQCSKIGGRLCSATEITAGVGKSTGCQFDSKFVWTSTKCTGGGGGYIKAKANGETECRGVGENGPLKCCSDVSLNSSPAPYVYPPPPPYGYGYRQADLSEEGEAAAVGTGKSGKQSAKAAAYVASAGLDTIQRPSLTSSTGGKMVVLGMAFMVALTVVGAIQSLVGSFKQEIVQEDEMAAPLLHSMPTSTKEGGGI
jgi:hypothetical protein